MTSVTGNGGTLRPGVSGRLPPGSRLEETELFRALRLLAHAGPRGAAAARIGGADHAASPPARNAISLSSVVRISSLAWSRVSPEPIACISCGLDCRMNRCVHRRRQHARLSDESASISSMSSRPSRSFRAEGAELE